jgi:DNA-binding NtrC family response regulator
MRDVRREITSAADPHVTIYLHDSIALMEASRGRPDEARRHLRICETLLEKYSNAWLEQLVSVNRSFVDFFESKFDDALRSLRRAKALLPLTGERQRAVIEVNEGHALLGLGRIPAAIERFTSIVKHHKGFPLIAALDGLARAHLAADDLTECAGTLERLAKLTSTEPSLNAAFAARWTSVTRVKLLLRSGRFLEARQAAINDLADRVICEDRLLVEILRCLQAEASACCGDLEDAAHVLVRHRMEGGPITPDHHAAYYRAAGVALHAARSGLRNSALERAEAASRASGNLCAGIELKHRTATLAAGKVAASDVDIARSAVFSLASLFGCVNAPFVIAEMRAAIESLQCSQSIEVSEMDATRHRKEQAKIAVLDLGQHDGQHLQLRCDVPDDPLKALLLADVFRIARAALNLERYRREERNRAALWPADPVETEAGALFLSEEMQMLLADARRVAAANIPVLITGETGTGKEVLARLIHACSPRTKATFMPFNCTATPKDMLDSQLFGHRRGSFTGATDHFQGVIRAASGGTLFLDEIGETTLDVQPKLLRFLESSEVHPIGEAHPARVDVRVIAATNANLDALVAQGRFRQDLLYRLNTVELKVPPLRERRVEIPALATHYLRKYALENHKGDLRLAEDTMEYLVLYRWPGNVRQLANEMRRMAALAEKGAMLMPEHLSRELAASRRTLPPSQRVLDDTEVIVRLDQPLPAAVGHVERAMIQNALRKCGGRLEETAAMLGISRKGLYLKRVRYGLIEPGEEPAEVEVA